MCRASALPAKGSCSWLRLWAKSREQRGDIHRGGAVRVVKNFSTAAILYQQIPPPFFAAQLALNRGIPALSSQRLSERRGGIGFKKFETTVLSNSSTVASLGRLFGDSVALVSIAPTYQMNCTHFWSAEDEFRGQFWRAKSKTGVWRKLNRQSGKAKSGFWKT